MVRSGSRGHPGRAWAIVATVVATAITLGGCSGGSDGSAGSVSGGVAAPASADESGEAGLPAAGKVDSGAVSAASPGTAELRAPAVVGPRLIRTADVAVQVDDLAVAAGRVRAVAVGLGGSIASETTGFRQPVEQKPAVVNPDAKPEAAARGESLLVVRVPVARLDTAIDQVAGIGVVLSRTSTSQDVTGDLADVASRLATQRASVARTRALLARASRLQDVVLLESEMSKRESDLEALEARLASLTDQADLATLSVTLRTPPAASAATHDDRGFVAGLHNGWKAIGASTNVVLTVLGALLPVALVLALLGAPVFLVIRRRRARGHAQAPATP
jgi:Domain of unknown function (DUF4349)